METLFASKLVNLEKGLVSRKIFFSQELYLAELNHIFRTCWLFLGHESQVPKPGDYIANYMGEDPVIVWRDRHQKVRAFLNSCRHRGMKICRADAGNARQFTCIFHGWTYSDEGKLVGVSQKAAYSGRLEQEKWGLLEVPNVASYGGLVFGNWDRDALSLDSYLGELRWYLDILLERTLGGLEAIPGQQRFRLKANWKIAAENFAGDGYHVPYAHSSMRRVKNIRPFNPVAEKSADTLRCIAFDRGHGIAATGYAEERYESDVAMAKEMGPEVFEYVAECHSRLERRLSGNQVKVHALGFGNIFPNFSFNDFSALRPTGLYLWHPKGPGALEAWQWCLVDTGAPQSVKDMIRVDFSRGQSATGVAGQDDTENFEQVSEATCGAVGQGLDFNYLMDMSPNDDNTDGSIVDGYPGRFGAFFSEVCQRNFYRRWAELIDSA